MKSSFQGHFIRWAALVSVVSSIHTGCSSTFSNTYMPGLLISSPTATSVPACDAGAALFGGGSGTVADPYKICTRTHLEAIAGAYLGSQFIQKADFDLGGSSNPWAPGAANFTGTYDGNSKTISGLYYNTAGVNNVGLFRNTNGATIKNLTLSGVSITGTGTRTGAFVGRFTSSTIQNCHSSGTISSTSSATGGLVGYLESSSAITSSSSSATISGGSSAGGLVGIMANTATITSSSASGSVTGTAANIGGLVGSTTGGSHTIQSSYATGAVTSPTNQYVGGLLGRGQITISNSYATGTVSAASIAGGLAGNLSASSQVTSSYATGSVAVTTNYGGGLVGSIDNSSITTSYASGAVTGAIILGGLVGGFSTGGSITNSYARGDVGPGDSAGGLVGQAASMTLTNSYSTGRVSGSSDVGGLLGLDNGGNTVTHSYWDTVTSTQGASAAGTGLHTALMKDYNNFTGWDFAAIWNGAGYAGSSAVYPYLR